MLNLSKLFILVGVFLFAFFVCLLLNFFNFMYFFFLVVILSRASAILSCNDV